MAKKKPVSDTEMARYAAAYCLWMLRLAPEYFQRCVFSQMKGEGDANTC